MDQKRVSLLSGLLKIDVWYFCWAQRLWFLSMLVGHWVFATYLLIFYFGALISGDVGRWNKVLPHGHVQGELLGNGAVAIHVLVAVYLMFFGVLQLLPWLRNTAPRFHRLNGRAYISLMALVCLSGIYMVWTRGSVLGRFGDISITINGILVLVSAVATLYFARQLNFRSHRRWALRLFVLASGVWFFRILFSSWLIVHGKPVGFDPATFRGPVLSFLVYAQYLVPWLVLEIFFWVEEKSTVHRLAFALLLMMCSILIIFGTISASIVLWLPRL